MLTPALSRQITRGGSDNMREPPHIWPTSTVVLPMQPAACKARCSTRTACIIYYHLISAQHFKLVFHSAILSKLLGNRLCIFANLSLRWLVMTHLLGPVPAIRIAMLLKRIYLRLFTLLIGLKRDSPNSSWWLEEGLPHSLSLGF